jgi:hypothetical protein
MDYGLSCREACGNARTLEETVSVLISLLCIVAECIVLHFYFECFIIRDHLGDTGMERVDK